MINALRGLTVPFLVLLGACTVEKKDDATIADTPAATIVVPPPAPELPAPQPVLPPPQKTGKASDSTKPSKAVAKSTPKTPADTLERDSAIQPSFVIGADGKIRPIKKK
jgi:hypothetical protein